MSFTSKVLVIACTIFAVFNILRYFGLFEYRKRVSKTVNEKSEDKKYKRNRKIEQARLGIYSQTTKLFQGLLMPDHVREQHIYYIDRLELRSDILERRLTPEEVRGKYAFNLILSLLLVPLAIFWLPLFAVPIFCLVRFLIYQTGFKRKIADEDSIIDDNFIDMYLLLYSQLKRGSRARLQGTIENYIQTLESSTRTDESKVMMKLARYLLNLLAMYEDHQAVPRLREAYKSATIINFCNVATQALNGVENADNLLTFKMQLTDRKIHVMRKRQEKIIAKGNRSILLIWVILFIFILVGWYSKLPMDMFTSMFGN